MTSRSIWLAWSRAIRAYHRFEVDGLEHLDRGIPCLIAGYHGRPLAYDLVALSSVLYDRLGYLPRAIFHESFFRPPLLREFLEGIGGVPGDDDSLKAAVARGEHVIVTPGGSREGSRSLLDRHRVEWGSRDGYVRLAARLRVPIVPVACRGVDDAYLGLNDGYRLGRRVGMPARLPLWFGFGPLGLWPFSPPFPVRFRQHVGPPIPDTAEGLDPGNDAAVAEVHSRVGSAVQALLDRS
jgi:1-acyl-sn-glycerol-3-phosphate acyltransferase